MPSVASLQKSNKTQACLNFALRVLEGCAVGILLARSTDLVHFLVENVSPKRLLVLFAFHDSLLLLVVAGDESELLYCAPFDATANSGIIAPCLL